ncbi:MAG: FAD-dependent thymidylate synthase [Candidatus Aenigmatarchaeota archaeon]
MMKFYFWENEPVMLAALAAKISRSPFEKNIQELYEECERDIEKSKKLVNRIMKKYRHLIFGDFSDHAIVLDEISRLATIYIWRNVSSGNLVYGAGIEASLRVLKPARYHEIVSGFGELAFETYEKAIAQGIPEEDARYLLPEGTLTRMIFSAPPRYYAKIANSLKRAPLQELNEISEKIKKVVEEKFGLEIPEEYPASEWKFFGKEKIDERTFFTCNGDVYSISLDMFVEGSLAMYAQLVRERGFLCLLAPMEEIAERGVFVVPPTFTETVRKEYREIAEKAKEKQIELIEKKDPNFAYFLLLGQLAKGKIYGKGVSVVEASRTRSEGTAQWEIRNKVGIPITEELAKHVELRKEIGPRCWREKMCTEPSTFKTEKSICKAFIKAGGNWQGGLNELLDLLKETYDVFKV